MSRPRMFSLILTRVSPSGKELTTASPRGAPMAWQILRAKARCADPEKIFISRLNGVIAGRKRTVTLMLKSAFARGLRWQPAGGIPNLKPQISQISELGGE